MSQGPEAVEGVEIPAPLALHDYFRLLDDFAGSKPCRNTYIGELLNALDWGDRERTEYSQGQSSLWRLIPPITLEELREADFDPPALIALALSVVLHGRHALHFWEGRMVSRRMPAPLPEIERLSRFAAEALEAAGRRSSRGGVGRLDALRLELQTIRGGLEADARAREKAADGVKDGIASARRDDTAGSALRWRPRRLRKLTSPGLEAIRHITQPGVAMGMVTGEFLLPVDWEVDPQVPAPLGVYGYVQALGDFAAGKRLQQVFLHGLIDSVGVSGELLALFEAGRHGLWILIPPINATQVAEASLGVDAARALGVALYLRTHHALHHYLPDQTSGGVPQVLAECGEMLTVVKLALDSGRAGDEDPVIQALTKVAVRLAARGISAGGVIDQRREEIREVRRQEAESRREAEEEDQSFDLGLQRPQARMTFALIRGSSLPRMVMGTLLVLGLAGASAYLKMNAEALPPAATYRDVPAVAIIRHADEIVVRVPPNWMKQPRPSREGALRSLYSRFAKELGAHALPVIIVGLKNEPYGGVAGERVWWDAPEQEAVPSDKPPPPGAAPP